MSLENDVPSLPEVIKLLVDSGSMEKMAIKINQEKGAHREAIRDLKLRGEHLIKKFSTDDSWQEIEGNLQKGVVALLNAMTLRDNEHLHDFFHPISTPFWMAAVTGTCELTAAEHSKGGGILFFLVERHIQRPLPPSPSDLFSEVIKAAIVSAIKEIEEHGITHLLTDSVFTPWNHSEWVSRVKNDRIGLEIYAICRGIQSAPSDIVDSLMMIFAKEDAHDGLLEGDREVFRHVFDLISEFIPDETPQSMHHAREMFLLAMEKVADKLLVEGWSPEEPADGGYISQLATKVAEVFRGADRNPENIIACLENLAGIEQSKMYKEHRFLATPFWRASLARSMIGHVRVMDAAAAMMMAQFIDKHIQRPLPTDEDKASAAIATALQRTLANVKKVGCGAMLGEDPLCFDAKAIRQRIDQDIKSLELLTTISSLQKRKDRELFPLVDYLRDPKKTIIEALEASEGLPRKEVLKRLQAVDDLSRISLIVLSTVGHVSRDEENIIAVNRIRVALTLAEKHMLGEEQAR